MNWRKFFFLLPVEDSNVVKVKFGVTLQQIIGIDEKKQILMSNIWHNLEWHDPYMQWNESEYGNIKDIRYLNIKDFWETLSV